MYQCIVSMCLYTSLVSVNQCAPSFCVSICLWLVGINTSLACRYQYVSDLWVSICLWLVVSIRLWLVGINTSLACGYQYIIRLWLAGINISYVYGLWVSIYHTSLNINTSLTCVNNYTDDLCVTIYLKHQYTNDISTIWISLIHL